MRFVVMLAMIAGCGFRIHGGSAADDVPPDDAMPGDVIIDGDAPIDMPIDMPIDQPPMTNDQDGDTILDSVDNCVMVANTNQRNHDGDAFGDACDRCPHLASVNDPDGDNDGVGDACDPRPTNNMDHRAFWFGFYDASEIVGWTAQGTWTVSNGFLVQASTGLTGIAPPGNVNIPFVMTGLVVDNPNTNFEIGISVQAPANAFECALVKSGSNVNIRSRQQGTNNSSGQQNWTGTAAVGDRVRLIIDLANDVDCRAVQGTANVHPITTTSDDPTGRTYVGTSGIESRFDYLFVVDEAP